MHPAIKNLLFGGKKIYKKKIELSQEILTELLNVIREFQQLKKSVLNNK